MTPLDVGMLVSHMLISSMMCKKSAEIIRRKDPKRPSTPGEEAMAKRLDKAATVFEEMSAQALLEYQDVTVPHPPS